ncbi:hypothetical protein EYF80_013776 [Liparis tanakae]|uniref:Uncharacterized protein n=1 Tax=Liparis tanakae TaxID=230148 RepID=A0A4Z2IFX5_9TELE|nr:hypothetical protein EYF80_013776 [Liparis tanakae]
MSRQPYVHDLKSVCVMSGVTSKPYAAKVCNGDDANGACLMARRVARLRLQQQEFAIIIIDKGDCSRVESRPSTTKPISLPFSWCAANWTTSPSWN